MILARDPDACHFRVRMDWLSRLHHASVPELSVGVTPSANHRGERNAKRFPHIEHGAEQGWAIDPSEKTLRTFYPEGRSIIALGGIVTCEANSEGSRSSSTARLRRRRAELG